MDTNRKKYIEVRIGEEINRLEKNNPEIGKHKFEVAGKILKSLIGQTLMYEYFVKGGDMVLNILDAEDKCECVSEIVVKDNEIRVICTAWSYLDCFCGIDEIDRAVRGLNDIIEYSRNNKI